MTALWNRIKYTIQADLHDLLDKKEEKNPIALLNQYIREAEKQTDSVGKLLARQVKLKDELLKEQQAAAKMVEKRQQQLILATASEEEDLIAFANDEVLTYERRVADLDQSIMETTDELLHLERKFEEMKHQIKDMKIRQLQLMGKENVTRAHRRIQQVLSSEEMDHSLASMDEMKHYIERLGQSIEQQYEISTTERRLEMLEKNAQNKKEIV